jgi:RNA polymerase sigma factor (sigma-70 family)
MDREPLARAGERSDESLLNRYRSGCEDAARALYERYAARVRAVARSHCSGDLAARVDAEDIVQSVFRSFFHAAKGKRYDLPTGNSLWKTLLVIALNKIRNQRAHHHAAKRDTRLTVGGDALEHGHPGDESEAFVRAVVDDILGRFGPPHRAMLELRLQGHEVAGIATATGRSKRTVERALQECRAQLETLLHESD